METKRETRRGMTYKANYTGSFIRTDDGGRPTSISLFFATPDGAQRTLYTHVGTDERSLKGLAALKGALEVLGQKGGVLPIGVETGTECAVVLDSNNPGFVRFVNQWRTGNSDIDAEAASAVNSLLDETPY